jgi:sugar phosphate isomerase/epimerase
MMQLGFVTAILPELTLEEVISIGHRIGYRFVEVMCWPPSKADRRYAGVTHIDVIHLSEAEATAIQKKLADSDMAISGLGYYPNCLSNDFEEADRAVEHLKRVIATAPRLGLTQVNTFIGRDHTLSVEANWPRMLKTWKPIVDVAEKHGVRIGIENCPMLFTQDEWPGGKNLASSPAIWRRLFAELASPNLGLNYDPSHLVFQRMDYVKPIREFIDRIFHVHAKDVRVDQHALDDVGSLAYPNQYHRPKLPGLGDVDWGLFFSVLGDAGYRGPVCVEVEDRAYEATLGDRVASLAQSHRYLSQFVSS